METYPANSRIQTISLMVIAAVLLTYLIYWLRPVLVPFVVAVFVVSGITPILEYLENRLRVNRLVAAGITFLAGLMLMITLGISLWLSALDLAENAPAYRKRVTRIVTSVEAWLDFDRDGRPLALVPRSPVGIQQTNREDDSASTAPAEQLENAASSNLVPDASDDPANSDPANSDPAEEARVLSAGAGTNVAIENRLPIDLGADNSGQANAAPLLDAKNAPQGLTAENATREFKQFLDTILRDGFRIISSELVSLVSTSVVVLIYIFFLLLGRADLTSENETWKDIDQQIRSYLSLKTVISIATGAAFGLALALFGVPMAVTFGVLAFLLNYIPNIGPLVASILPVPLIILHPDGSIFWMFSAITVTSGIQVLSGNVIEPKLMGQSSDLHPVVVLLALMFWGMMWGITGMFLATPITSGIKIVLQRIDATKPVADMLAGRWPKTAQNPVKTA